MSQTDKILVVEDDDTLRLLTTKQLTRLGFLSDAVEDGSLALRKAAEMTYRLILMDVQMPLMDGLEATIAIREAEQTNNRPRVPIIAMTANPDRSLCLNADMDDFLFKPVMLPELEQLLKKWLPKEKKADLPEANASSHAGASAKEIPLKSIEPQFGFAASASPAASVESGSDCDINILPASPDINVNSGSSDVQNATDASAPRAIIE